MGKRKKTYAEKHLAASIQAAMSVSLISDNEDLQCVLRSPRGFEKSFLELPYERQIALVDIFKDIIHENILITPKKLKKSFEELAYDKLEKIHWMTGSFYEEGNSYFPISEDEKKLVRMECYGSIDKRRDHELSACYKFFNRPENKGKYRLKDYDLATSPMWQVFNQFESFREIAPKVKRQLYKNRINPDALKVMSVSDFCDVIYQAFTESPDKQKAHFLQYGYKNRFVKDFMKACGRDLENQLIGHGHDPRAVHSLCRMMAKYGICETHAVTVTELHYTQRILDDLSKHKYNVSGIKVGDPISEEVTDLLFDREQESLILARDENGQPLNALSLPSFEVHHKNAVKFAHDDDYLAKVNHWNNLMLVEKDMHRIYYHGFDSVFRVNPTNECYYARLNSSIPSMCLVNGFNAETDILYADLENNAAQQRRKQKDSENVVNYYMMQYERLNQITQVADQYGIEYSKNDVSLERKNVANLLQVEVNISAADVKKFQQWLNPRDKKKIQNKRKLMAKDDGGR